MILTLRMMETKIVAKDAKQYDLIRDINTKVFKQAFGLDYTDENLTQEFDTIDDNVFSRTFQRNHL